MLYPEKERFRILARTRTFFSRVRCSIFPASWIIGFRKDSRIRHRRFPSIRETAQGVSLIRKMVPVNLIVYYPKTAEGKQELIRRVTDVHASTVTQQLKLLNCPDRQKLELLNAVIETVKKQNRGQT